MNFIKNTNYLLFVFTVMSLCCYKPLYSQIRKNEDNPWIIGLGVSAIDDSGTSIKQRLSLDNKVYHFRYPFKIVAEKRFKDDFGVELSSALNTFKTGKFYNGEILNDKISFFTVDVSLKYYITNLFIKDYFPFYEGFLITGLGKSFNNSKGGNIFNIGGGLTFFITEHFRLTAQSVVKSFLSKRIGGGYLQYDLMLSYVFPKK